MAQWKIKKNDQTYGPYTGRQIKQLVVDGKIKPETLLSKDGSKWIAAKNIKGILQQPTPKVVAKSADSNFDEAVASLRKKLNEYSNRVPCHSFPDLGNQIQINDVKPIKVCNIEGTTWIEKRIATINRIGTTDLIGGRIPKSDDINSIRPWDTNLDQPRPPIQTSRDHKIPDLEGVHVCDGCRGEGQIGCMTCRSKGQVICPKCNRAGVVNCSMCSGAGTTMAQRQVSRQQRCVCIGGKIRNLLNEGWKICPACNGTGVAIINDVEQYPVVCTDCAGNRKVACANCSQAGVVTCSKCKGKTFLTCSSCNGQKHLRHTAVIKQSFTPKKFNQDHICELEIQSDTQKLVRKFEKRLAISGDLDSFGSELKAFKFLIAPVQSEFAKTDKVSGSEQVLDRTLTVREASVFKVSYALKGNEYVAFVGDIDCDFTSNPITHELAWSLSQGTSISALAKGHKMSKECSECKRIVDSASEGVSSLNKLMARGLSVFTSSTPPVAASSVPTQEFVAKEAKPPVKAQPPAKVEPQGLISRMTGTRRNLIFTLLGGFCVLWMTCFCGVGLLSIMLDPEGFAEFQRDFDERVERGRQRLQQETRSSQPSQNDNNGVEKSTTNEQDMRLRQIDGTFIIQAKKVLGSDHEHLARMITDKRKSFSLYEWENIEDVYATDFRRNSTFNELYQSWKIARLGREQVIGRRRY